MSGGALQTLLFLAGILLQCVLVGVLVWRRAFRTNPAFFGYITVCCAVDALLYVVQRFATVYFTVYYVGDVLKLGLLVAVGVEVFFGSFASLRVLSRRNIAALAAAVSWVIVTIAVVTFNVDVSYANRIARVTSSLDRAITLTLFAVFLFLMLFSSTLNSPWSRRTNGIGLGFLFSLPIDTVVTWLQSFNGAAVNAQMWVVWTGRFYVTEFIWLIVFLLPEQVRYRGTIEDLLALQREIRDGKIIAEVVQSSISQDDDDPHRYWLARKPEDAPNKPAVDKK